MRSLVGGIIKANHVFKFIKNKDRILVGVSGGKDSTLLLMALNLYANYMKQKHHWNIKVYGLHIIMNYYNNIDYSKYKKWLKDHKLDVKFVQSNIGEILKAKLNSKGKPECSLCSKLKKAILVKHAKKMKVNKIATGHHIDDAIETLFMNMINEGRISVFSANNYLDRNKIHLIRPFCLIKENHIKKVSKQLKIPTIENSCPNEHDTQRSYMKDFLYTNFYKNPRFKASEHNFQVALLNGNQSNLWFDNKNKKQDLLIHCKRDR